MAGLFLLLFTRRLHPSNILGFCIAFSNAYGLVAAIFLLGSGLVAVPRQLWKSADLAGEQRRLYHAAGMQARRCQRCRAAAGGGGVLWVLLALVFVRAVLSGCCLLVCCAAPGAF